MGALPIGVVGVGSLGFHHARILRDLDGVRLVGVHDVDASRLEQVTGELGVKPFRELDDLLGLCEAVVVAVPTREHAQIAHAAVDRGVHLLIEKPIAATLAEAQEINRHAERSGVLVATGHVERFNSAIRACDPFLEAPRFIESQRLSPFGVRGTDVAVVLDLMIHDIDLVLSLAGREVAQVDAVGVPVLTPSVDIANARLRFQGGSVANITASRVSRDRLRKVRLFQPSGYLSLDLGAGTGEFLRLRKGIELGTLAAQLAGGAASPPSLEALVERVELENDGEEPLRAELAAFVAAVRGEGELVVSGRDGERALAVALDIVAAIDSAAREAYSETPVPRP